MTQNKKKHNYDERSFVFEKYKSSLNAKKKTKSISHKLPNWNCDDFAKFIIILIQTQKNIFLRQGMEIE